MPSDLLDDLNEEQHQFLLESGNLGNKRKSSEWTGANNWVSKGYTARCRKHICTGCGDSVLTLMGIFHTEENGLGARRSTALLNTNHQIPLDGPKNPVIIHEEKSRICPACLDLYGFSLPSNES